MLTEFETHLADKATPAKFAKNSKSSSSSSKRAQKSIRINSHAATNGFNAGGYSHGKKSGNLNKRHNSDLSLSTIAEESQSYLTSSQDSCSSASGAGPQQTMQSINSGAASVFVEPHVTVETTTYPTNVRNFED